MHDCADLPSCHVLALDTHAAMIVGQCLISGMKSRYLDRIAPRSPSDALDVYQRFSVQSVFDNGICSLHLISAATRTSCSANLSRGASAVEEGMLERLPPACARC